MKEKFIKMALDQAYQAVQQGEMPIGVVIVRGDQVIAKAHNLKETLNCATKHAEILAIEAASKINKDWRLNDCEVYVTMEPCLMCCGALIQARIKKVYYLVENEKFGGSDFLEKVFSYEHINHNVEFEKIVDNFFECEYKQILKSFFINKR